MNELAISQARDEFADLVNRVAYGKERIVIKRRGKAIVALIPFEDLEILQDFEDEVDREILRRVDEDPENREPPIPIDEIKREFGL